MYPYYEDTVAYFIHGERDSSNVVTSVVSERFQRTGRGDSVYITLSQLMLDYEYNHTEHKQDLEEMIRKIIGISDPNNTIK